MTGEGAQSGGVVTFEPDRPGGDGPRQRDPPPSPPPLRGVRSRVVNAKRTDLSRRVRRRVAKDNCGGLTGNLRGWNESAYTLNDGGGGW